MSIESNREPGLPLTNRQLLALAGRAREPRLQITQFRRGKAMACGLLAGKMNVHKDDSVALRTALDEWWRSESTSAEVLGPRFSWGYNLILAEIASILQGDTSTINWNIGRLPADQRRTR